MLTKEYAKPHTMRLVVNAVVKMTATMLEVVLPAILAFIVDSVIPRRDRQLIIFWGIMMILFSIGAWVTNVIANRMAARTSSLVIQKMRSDLFGRSMTLSARQIDKLSISSLESRLTTDTYNLHRFLGALMRMGIRSIMLFVGGVFFCFWLSWQLALVLLLLIPPLFIAVRLILKKGIPLFREVQRNIDEMVQVIRENIRGIRVSKSLDKTDYEKGRFAAANDQVKDGEIKANDQMAKMSPIVNIILYSGLMVILILGAVLANRGLTQAGTIMAFLSYFIQITNSLLSMNRMFNMYNRASASAARLEEVLYMPLDSSQVVDPATQTALPEANPEVPEIEFRDVSFSYLKNKDDLSKINFKLYPGETLGIMGATGSGKSSVIRLLLRQYDTGSGEILLRGVNIKQLNSSDLHRLFGSVFQNDFLFGATVRKNIDFGRGLSDDELRYAIENAQATEFIDQKEGGLDFVLSSKGVNLSGGQKQRILLSRALAGQPQILILDDSSSALDFRTDANLRQALKENFGNTTAIIVAQRVSSVRHAEKILFLESGEMLAFGSHEELLESCEPYREIAQMQMGSTSDTEEVVPAFHSVTPAYAEYTGEEVSHA